MIHSLFYQILTCYQPPFLAWHTSDSCFLLLLAMMQAYSFVEKWHKSTTNGENMSSGLVNFLNRRIFFWICLEIIKTMEGHFNLLDTFLTLDGFKNYKVVLFKMKFDLNKFPQNLLDWHENGKFDEIVINFLKIYEQLTLSLTNKH